MVLHKIEEGKLTEYAKIQVSTEFEIHNFIEKHPEILGKNIFIVGREVKTVDGNYIDLLGLNQNGDAIIIEIKKEQTPRKVIGQILEYAEWVSNSIGSDELNKISKIKHLTNYPTLWKKYETEFSVVPEFNEHQQLYIVAEKIDPVTEKLARYLRKNGIDIFCVELNFYEKNGDRFCETKLIVGKEKVVLPDISGDSEVNYDWKYYSERKGWSDDVIVEIKKFVTDVIENGKKEGIQLHVKFNQYYCAIQNKGGWNMFALLERRGMIRIELPALRKNDEPPESDLDWKWSESQSFWVGNFSLSEMPSAGDMKAILKKSYDFR